MIGRWLPGGLGIAICAFLLAPLGEAHASTILAVNGSFLGGTGAAGLSEGWSTNAALENVDISAVLKNGNSLPSAGVAYLTTSIGPGTTLADVIAKTNVDLNCYFCQEDVTLFQGLSLAPGTYWLTFGTPAPPASFLIWDNAMPATLITGPGITYLGYEALLPFYSPFPPSGTFYFPSPIVSFSAYGMSVTGTPVPEPAQRWLCGLALVSLLAWMTRRKRTCS
jgi:hypothetical protein